MMGIVIFVMVQNKQQGVRLEGEIAARKKNDQERTGILKEVRGIVKNVENLATTQKTQGDTLVALANKQDASNIKQEALLVQVKLIAQQIPQCFQEGGLCQIAAKRNQAFVVNQLQQAINKISNIEYKVTQIDTAPDGNPRYKATPVNQFNNPLVLCIDALGQSIINTDCPPKEK